MKVGTGKPAGIGGGAMRTGPELGLEKWSTGKREVGIGDIHMPAHTSPRTKQSKEGEGVAQPARNAQDGL